MTNALVVDDDDTIRGLLAGLLSDEGYVVDEAANGQEALNKVSRRQPDILLLDLMMPVMDGWRFLKECRDIPDCAHLPVVVLSASHRVPQDERVRAFISKPFDIDAVAGTIRSIAPP